MLYRSCIMALLISLGFNTAYTQEREVSNVVGKNYIIPSAVLNEEREIQVFLPEGYENNDKDYPVLYVLDGQRFYLYGVSLLQSFSRFQLTPAFIVVGITNSYPHRFGYFSSRADKFMHFIEGELIPFIDTKFRVNGERLVFGWEYGGGFIFQMMMEKPLLFDAHLMASPYPINDMQLPVSDSRMKLLAESIKKKTLKHEYLCFSVSDKENAVSRGVDYLKDVFQSDGESVKDWDYLNLINEEHRSTPYSTLYHGIRKYYGDYPELTFDSLSEYDRLGGMTYVEKYYQKRSRRYGFPDTMAQNTMFNLVLLSKNEHAYNRFDGFMNRFGDFGFLDELRINWGCVFAEYYLENKAYDKAKHLYAFYAEKFPKAARPQNGLGDIYALLNKKRKARAHYEKAIELGASNSDWRLQEYKDDLDRLK